MYISSKGAMFKLNIGWIFQWKKEEKGTQGTGPWRAGEILLLEQCWYYCVRTCSDLHSQASLLPGLHNPLIARFFGMLIEAFLSSSFISHHQPFMLTFPYKSLGNPCSPTPSSRQKDISYVLITHDKEELKFQREKQIPEIILPFCFVKCWCQDGIQGLPHEKPALNC